MFFHSHQKPLKRVIAGFLIMALIGPSLTAVITEAALDPAAHGLQVGNQSNSAGYEIPAMEDGTMTIIQKSTSGYNATQGSRDQATLFTLGQALEGDFSMSLDLEAASFGGSNTGIFAGAFSGLHGVSPFTSMAIRSNNSGSAIGFGYKRNSSGAYEFGTTGSSASLSTNTRYTLTFTRNGNVFSGGVAREGSPVTSYTIDYSGSGIQEMLSGAPLYPGFSVLGATVKVSNFVIWDEQGDLLFDSAPLWGSDGGGTEPVDWDAIAAPLLSEPLLSPAESDKIDLNWEMAVGNGFADSIKIVVTEETLGTAAEFNNEAPGLGGTVSYYPAASGRYTFTAYGTRAGELDKISNTVGPVSFNLPLKAPGARLEKVDEGLLLRFTQVAEAVTYLIRDLSADEDVALIDGTDLGKLPDGVTFSDHQYTVSLPGIVPQFHQFEVKATNQADESAVVICSLDTRAPSRKELPLSYNGIDSFLAGNLMVPMDKARGSSQITGLQVPVLAYDDTSVTLVWEKPEKYDDIADYNIYVDGEYAGSARENFAVNADWANTYMKAFYDGYPDDGEIDMVKVDIHSFRATGLAPKTRYRFEVRSVNAAGDEIEGSSSGYIEQETTAVPDIFDIMDFGAVPVPAGPVADDDEMNLFIVENTKAIQRAIDACTPGGKVLIPAGIFVTGAIYLKSNMTLELADEAILWGSPNADHYDQNYLLYPYSTDTRSWALVNAYSADENGMIQNIRITGKGTLYGNGWKYGTKDSISGTGYDPYYTVKDRLDSESSDYQIEEWVAGNNVKVLTYGVLAADAVRKGQESGLTAAQAYSKRPNLVVLRGVDGIYLEDFSAKNPAFHTVAILDSRNIVSNNVKYMTYDVNNADGIEIGNSQNALIFNNFFDTGDDSINFATGLGKGVEDSEQHPSKDIWTFNNFIRNGHGGAIAAGSHTGAGIYNMLVEDNVINLNEMPFRFKSNPINGGGISHVLIRDCAIANCKQLFTFTTSYQDSNQVLSVEPADGPAEFTDIKAYNVTADRISKNTFEIYADVKNNYNPWHTHRNMYYQDIAITNAAGTESLKAVEDVTFDHVTIQAPGRVLWNSINYSSRLRFINETTTSEHTVRAEKLPVWPADSVFSAVAVTATASNAAVASPSNAYETATVTLGWSDAFHDGDDVLYTVETYLNGVLADQSDLIQKNSYVIPNLSPDTAYTFKVIAWGSAGNSVEGAFIRILTPSSGAAQIVAGIEDSAVMIVNGSIGYTWATARFKNAFLLDKRVRGYHVYLNGTLAQTLYHYQIRDADIASSLEIILKRLEPGRENEITISAFTDSGIEYGYQSVVVETLAAYDYQAPIWPAGAGIAVEGVTEDGKLVLSWDEAIDPSGIKGYRLYVDEMPVLGAGGKAFNHVNGEYTTSETTYILDITVDEPHVFRVEAGDDWWRAANGTGPYHWTFSGPVLEYDGEIELPQVPNPGSTRKKTTTAAKPGWSKVAGRWRFADRHGRYLTGWLQDNGLWYFLGSDGFMKTGWLLEAGKWYFLGADGQLLQNQWHYDQGYWYYLGEDGGMATSTWIDGYQLDGNGVLG